MDRIVKVTTNNEFGYTGDVSDYGIHSTLLMTIASAFVRLSSNTTGDIANIVSIINFHLTIDIEDGGRLMTLFYLLIDIEN